MVFFEIKLGVVIKKMDELCVFLNLLENISLRHN
jgi:hypothetical protein